MSNPTTGPSIWPDGTTRAGAAMLPAEHEAWLLGYCAGMDRAVQIMRQPIEAIRESLGPLEVKVAELNRSLAGLK